jgi:hypothetical protein
MMRKPRDDRPRQADEGGINPAGLGPAQPRGSDNDHDQVPQEGDKEHLTEAEHADMADTTERERDA